MEQRISFPLHRTAPDVLLSRLEDMRKGDVDWKKGRVFSLVYDAGEAHRDLMKKAYMAYFSENGLNPMAFQSLRRMELETVRMCADLLNGGTEAVGTLTSGGTESILLSVKAARERAHRIGKRGKLNVVYAETVHSAFDKAADYFEVEPRYARIGKDYRVDVRDMEKLIDDKTILLVGSAPQYVQGVVDPIGKLGALALKKKLPLHVDACVGGFILPWLERLGVEIPPWDFRVPGVTSISADIHKYGFAPKGSSVIMYRNMDYLKHQFFVSTNWSGGVYASPGIAGSKPGGAIATAWATMVALGEEGFLELAQKAWNNRNLLLNEIRAIPELEVVGEPDATVFSFRTREKSGVDIFAVADRMDARGWFIDRHQNPNAIHCTVMAHHTQAIEDYARDLRAAIQEVRAQPELSTTGNAAMYGMMAKVPFRGLISKKVHEVMEQMYAKDALQNFSGPAMGGEKASFIDSLIEKHGAKLNRVLDAKDKLQDKLKLKPRRKR